MPAFNQWPLITLTTDFGPSDHYVASMKGVIFSRCPNAGIVDITHQIPAFNLLTGAYAVDQAAPYFPPKTIHVVVVDPGVGTSRKALLLQANDMQFLAPDNGVLSLILHRYPDFKIRELSNTSLFLPKVSGTFHGRDIFAAVAGALAVGSANSVDVGPELEQLIRLPGLTPRFENETWQGLVLSVDHFGNIVTNLPSVEFEAIQRQSFRIFVNDQTVLHYYSTFGDVPRGVEFAYFGSSGYIELGMNQANAAALWNVTPGNAVTLTLDQ